MPFAAALSTADDAARALEEAFAGASWPPGGSPDLALLFFSPHHAPAVAELAAGVEQRFSPRCLLGCCGESVIGNDQEVEQRPALSLWLGRWPKKVQTEPFHLTAQQTPDGPSLLGWPDGIVGADPEQAVMLLLGDPYTFPVDLFFRQVNEGNRGLRVMGGMASGGEGVPLVFGGRAVGGGAVGVLLRGPMKVRSIVSQGCRPVGRHMVITKARDNLILELGGKPPLVRMQQLWQELTPGEQGLVRQGLHLGVVINEYQGDFRRGDFLVRNVLGFDRDSGAMAVTERVRVGQTVQFHVRDAETADEDLHALLQMDLSAHARRPGAALAFSCNGRGTRMFPAPHHDARAIRQEAGDIPLAGFFAAGELGPVGGQNFIHGFTASVVLFEE